MFRSKKLLIVLVTIFTFSLFLQSTLTVSAKDTNDERISGYALVQPVNVYASPSRDAAILKSYDYNHPLIYQTYSSDWYVAVVFINGIAYKGYINKGDVGNISEAQSVKGVTLNKTNVHSSTSTSSRILKSYSMGSIIKYRSYNKNWYIVTVYVNAKKQTGYIPIKDVETIVNKPIVSQGIGIKKPTKVYSKPFSNAKVIKSYQAGQILRYRTFTKNWYEATVYVNGKKLTGYISIKDTEPVLENHQNLNGVGIKQTIPIYTLASKGSKVIKEYKYGHILKYRTFTNNWYEATVYLNGKAHTGYIFNNDVDNDINKALGGYAIKNPTKVYSDTSRSSSTLKSYKKGKILKYRPYNSNWFMATVYLNGKARTGYIHTSDVSPNAPSMQSYALKNPTYVYSKASRNSSKLKSYKKGQLLKFTSYNDNWYKATVYIKGKKKTGYIFVNDVGALPVKKVPGYNIPILMYHQIGENPLPDEIGRFVTVKNFKEQMKYLKTAGYTPINFDEIHTIKNIKKPIIITFDDGYENNIIAYNVLKDLRDKTFKPKATFFIIGSEIDKNNYLSLEQIKEISDSGIISIQSHTMTHPFFNDNVNAGTLDLIKELKDNKYLLEGITGKKVTAIAYPYGSYNNTVINEVKKYYDFAVTTKPEIANTNDSYYELPRVRVSFNTTLQDFKKLIVK
ncbi:polysaccharide deacetylase family protein [Camelliibacillus cellulosilyticus]|uniref:Polysaccharide deacetylase family protein n=1 Tax=Camelliibacillus cellulosilyticus TaxID=2174486 RepID=A0ABV9GQX7_9BACL